MKLYFCLHGMHLSYPYQKDKKFPVIWINKEFDRAYPPELLAYVVEKYGKNPTFQYWTDYTLRKL